MTVLSVLEQISRIIGLLFVICYAYQLFYIPVALTTRKRTSGHKASDEPTGLTTAAKPHRFAILISARNEEAVLPHLIDSIHRQDYPKEMVTVFVVADNCTDRTAEAAREAGAVVYERFDRRQTGKGYALNYLLTRIQEDWGDVFDAYLVFDADNLLKEDYLKSMNETFSQGYPIITSYRNSKNYGDNWISAGYGLWFLRESVFLNGPRFRLGVSCIVSGTGFLFSREVLHEFGGTVPGCRWPFHTLTEDIEFSVYSILQGHRIAYCPEAEFFDEQPTDFRQSWRQRLRWSKGYLQVFQKDGAHLFAGLMSRKAPSCFDALMSIFPAMVLSLCGLLSTAGAAVLELTLGGRLLPVLGAFLSFLTAPYGLLLLVGALTTLTQWRHIHTTAPKKLFYTLTFPLFMLTYIPISLAALFSKVEWTPIRHKAAVSITELR